MDGSFHKELACWFALLRAPAVVNATIRRLLQQVGTPEYIFKTDRKLLSEFGLHQKTIEYLQAPPWEKVKYDLL